MPTGSPLCFPSAGTTRSFKEQRGHGTENVPESTGGATPALEVLEALAERVGSQAHARTVYGDPVEREGVTVIPVASVRWGFGI